MSLCSQRKVRHEYHGRNDEATGRKSVVAGAGGRPVTFWSPSGSRESERETDPRYKGPKLTPFINPLPSDRCHPLNIPQFYQIKLLFGELVFKYMSLWEDICHSNHSNCDIRRQSEWCSETFKMWSLMYHVMSLMTLPFKSINEFFRTHRVVNERIRLAALIFLDPCLSMWPLSYILTWCSSPWRDTVWSGSGPSVELAPYSLYFWSPGIQPKVGSSSHWNEPE